MTSQTYVLVVSINDYEPSSRIPSLQGCNNDANAFVAYLEGRVTNSEQSLHVKRLFNEQATRKAVIDGFRNHLCQAGPDDVAVFFFAGHGSQENAPEEFWYIEPDRLDETLVCYDSRTEGGWDLADKELAQLIAEVAEKHPHIVAIMDCCHSGSGTRGDLASTVAVRRAPVDRRQRPLSSFIVSPDQLPPAPATRSLNTPTSGWQMPQGRHVLMAACRDIEEAKEYSVDGEYHGTFSYFLLETLQKANGSLTYRELFKRVSALVQSRVTAQSPQLEAHIPDDINQPFLGGMVKPRLPHFQVAFDRAHGWTMDGGAIHGIAQPVAGETTALSLFPFDADDDTIRQGRAPLGTATVTEVKPSLSQVQVTGIPDLKQDMTFKAVIRALPLPPMGIHVSGDANGAALLREAIAKAGDGVQQPSLYIRTVEDLSAAKFQVLVQDSQYRIKRPADNRILVAPIADYTPASAAQTVQRLEHLARWTTTLELQSSPTSRIVANAVQMGILQSGQTTEATDLRLTYSPDGKPPKIQIRLKNTTCEPLYCAIVNLTERFGIQVPFFEAGGVWLEPDQAEFAKYFDKSSGTTKTLIPISIPKDVLAQGVTEYKDVLKLLVSNTEFDARLLTQENLDAPRTRSLSRSVPQGMLNRSMNKVQTRDIGGDDDDDIIDDWVTSQLTITTVRPSEFADLTATSETQLMAGVSIQNATGFQAKGRLTTVNQSTRDLGNHILPPLLRDLTQPFQFTPTRATDPGLSALELTDIHNREAVTIDNPLKILANASLETDTYILPVAYDGEFYIPLGSGITKGQQTEITINCLPEPISEGKRSLGGAIRIFFQKVIANKLGPELSEKLGLSFEYPLLAAVEMNNGDVTYVTDPAIVSDKVAQAKCIALYIHGIIGDTRSMVPSMETAIATLERQQKPLKDCYDLILAFDYESLNTPIDTHARGLKQRLREVGLEPNHGKTFHIIAHSMGGLVSRWFIEREGGNAVVQHLILLGTPSAGSPWPQVQASLTLLATLIINGLSSVAFPLRALGFLLQKIEDIDVTLDDMTPDSEFLKELATSDDPGIPYTVIAGNTSLITSPPDTLAGKLTARLKKLMELPFFGEPNDLAVTVKSTKSIPNGRNPAPVMTEVECDHLVYFMDPAGVRMLGTAIQYILSSASSYSEAISPVTGKPSQSIRSESVTVQPSNSPGFNRSSSWLGWLLGLVVVAIIGVVGWQILRQPDSGESDSFLPQSFLLHAKNTH